MKTETNAPLSYFHLDADSDLLPSFDGSNNNNIDVIESINTTTTDASVTDDENEVHPLIALKLKNICGQLAKYSLDMMKLTSNPNADTASDNNNTNNTSQSSSSTMSITDTNNNSNNNVNIEISNMRLKLVLFMSEPDMSDTSTWILWFDSLQGMKQYLEVEIDAIKNISFYRS